MPGSVGLVSQMTPIYGTLLGERVLELESAGSGSYEAVRRDTQHPHLVAGILNDAVGVVDHEWPLRTPIH